VNLMKVNLNTALWLGVFPFIFLAVGVYLYFVEFNPRYIKFSYVLVYLMSLALYMCFLPLGLKERK